MRTLAGFVTAMLLGSCNQLLGLTAVEPPPDGPHEPPPKNECGDGEAKDADEDGDGVVNFDDNCPHVANDNQANVNETALQQPADDLGDACDGDAGGQFITHFLPFCAAAELDLFAPQSEIVWADGAIGRAAGVPVEEGLITTGGKTGVVIAQVQLVPTDGILLELRDSLGPIPNQAVTCTLDRNADAGDGSYSYHLRMYVTSDGVEQGTPDEAIFTSTSAVYAVSLHLRSGTTPSCSAHNAEGAVGNAIGLVPTDLGDNAPVVAIQLRQAARISSLLLACNGTAAACAQP